MGIFFLLMPLNIAQISCRIKIG